MSPVVSFSSFLVSENFLFFIFHLFVCFSSSQFYKIYLSLFVGLSLTNLIFSLLYHAHSTFSKKLEVLLKKFSIWFTAEISWWLEKVALNVKFLFRRIVWILWSSIFIFLVRVSEEFVEKLNYFSQKLKETVKKSLVDAL